VFERLLDMARTAVNIAGDSMVACVVARSESQMDHDCFHSEVKGS
jgi:Na+/H+-dicarboxylate symporter